MRNASSSRRTTERVARPIALWALLLGLGACSSSRAGWSSRGAYWKLHESPTLQVRRGTQWVDPATGELAITWIGARAPAGSPPLLACEVRVFDDRDGDGRPAPDESLCIRESLERTGKVLFHGLRVRARPESRLRALVTVRTSDEICEVGWLLEPD